MLSELINANLYIGKVFINVVVFKKDDLLMPNDIFSENIILDKMLTYI